MKSLLYLMFFVLLTSCSTTSENLNQKSNQQKWQLVKMSGNTANSITTGANMEWQETIELLKSQTFEKVRVRGGKTYTASGSYAFLQLEDGTYLELTYSKKNDLIGNCYGNLKEMYWVISDTQLRGTWLACDGPGLEYELIK